MYSSNSTKKYEEFAYVLDFVPHGESAVIRERKGPIIQAVGEDRLTLLEILATNEATFETGERIPIGKENRSRILSVLGKLNYSELTNQSSNELQGVLEKMVKENEARFIEQINELQPITPRLHALELIPGIGKTFMRQIVNQRDRRKFDSLEDLERRTGVRDPAKLIARRLIEELSGGSRILIFVRH